MAQNDDFFDLDDLEDAQGSDLVKKLRAKIDEMSKAYKSLQSENENLKTSERKRSVASVLESKGYNAKIAAFIPADLDPTEDNLNDWLAEYGDVFGGPAQGQEPQETQDPEAVRAQQRVAAVEGAGNPALSNDVLDRIGAAVSEEELLAILRGA